MTQTSSSSHHVPQAASLPGTMRPNDHIMDRMEQGH